MGVPDPIDPSTLVRWLYLDMNSFFASVEQEMNPSLRGKPVAVVPVLADSTSCIAVSYEGKAYGVKTGTKVGEAKRLCPKIEFVVGDHKHYIQYHHRIIEAVESCVPVEAVCSIDEIACRLTGSQQNVDVATSLAFKIKKTIRSKVGSTLCCSIGLAPNRYLAKIAADMNKPDGFTVIRLKDLPLILFPLKLRDLTGIGEKTEERLNRYGIHTMQKLCLASSDELKQAWGSINGSEMYRLLRGEELPDKWTGQKSISHSHVLPPELRNRQDALKTLKKLTTKAALRLRREGFWASSIQISVGFSGGQDSWSARSNVMETQATSTFIQAVNEHWNDLPHGKILSTGVVLSGLVPDAEHIVTLFDDLRRENLTKTMDKVNERFGKDVLHYGATHDVGTSAPLRIAFTRIPKENEG